MDTSNSLSVHKPYSTTAGVVLVWGSIVPIWLSYLLGWSKYASWGLAGFMLVATLLYSLFAFRVAGRTAAGPRLKLHLRIVAVVTFAYTMIFGFIYLTAVAMKLLR